MKLTGAGFLTEPDVLPAQGAVRAGRHHRPLLHAAPRQPDQPALREGVPGEVFGKMPDGFAVPGLRHGGGHRARGQGAAATPRTRTSWWTPSPRSSSTARAGHFRFDPEDPQRDPAIHLRARGREVSGGLNNVPIDKVADVKDPGTGCTLPA